MEKAKEIVFREHLQDMETHMQNVHVWENPIHDYGEDDGRHPTPEQTSELLKYIDKKTKENLHASIFLPSGANDFITSSKRYSGVQSLYKYGCAACNDKTRNKWWGLCTACQERAEAPKENGLTYGLGLLSSIAEDIQERENPTLQKDTERVGYGHHPTSPDVSVRERSPLKDTTSPDTPNNGSVKKIKLF